MTARKGRSADDERFLNTWLVSEDLPLNQKGGLRIAELLRMSDAKFAAFRETVQPVDLDAVFHDIDLNAAFHDIDPVLVALASKMREVVTDAAERRRVAKGMANRFKH